MMLPEMLWVLGTVAVVGYVLLFVLAYRPVTLRLARVGWLLIALLGVRLTLTLVGVPFEGTPEVVGTLVLGVLGSLLLLAWRVWLVRGTAEEVREQIHTACRGLFLPVEETQKGVLKLTKSGQPQLRLWRLTSGIQLLVLCRVGGGGKVALLRSWLAKEYPGPMPRPRIVLKGGAS